MLCNGLLTSGCMHSFEADCLGRAMSMPYLPSPPLPVPDSMPPVSEAVVSVGLENLGIVTEEEEQSNQQLYYKVFISVPAGQPASRAGVVHMTPETTNTILLQALLREE